MVAFTGTALVIGAASSDGLAVASRLAQLGCLQIAIADADGAALRTTELVCRAVGTPDLCILVQQCNPQVIEELDALMDTVIQKFGKIDCCANCLRPSTVVGNTTIEENLDPSSEQYKEIPQLWQRSVWLCMKAEVKCILKTAEVQTQASRMRRASIVNIAAVQGIASEAGFASFVAAAHGVVGATRATAMDYLKDGIRLNCVCPGPVSSAAASDEGYVQQFNDSKTGLPSLPHGRYITSDDVANAVVFLLGDESAAITGIELPIDSEHKFKFVSGLIRGEIHPGSGAALSYGVASGHKTISQKWWTCFISILSIRLPKWDETRDMNI